MAEVLTRVCCKHCGRTAAGDLCDKCFDSIVNGKIQNEEKPIHWRAKERESALHYK